MDNKIKKAYEDYLTLGAKIKELTAQRKKAQDLIKGYHAEMKLDLITEEGFKSQIIHKETTSLDEKKVIAKFGEEAVADCYTTKPGESFSCTRLITEG